MKKSVLLVLIFMSVATFLWVTNAGTIITGMQVLDLPPPPPPPGMDGGSIDSGDGYVYDDEVIYTPDTQRTAQPSQQPAQQPRVEQPVPTQAYEQQQEQQRTVKDLESRVNSLESRVDQLAVNVQNLRSRPATESPAELQRLESRTFINTMLTTVFIGLLLALVVLFFVYQRVKKKKAESAEKDVIAEYIRSYEKQGYDRDTLKEHLRASGWSDELIEEAEKDMWV